MTRPAHPDALTAFIPTQRPPPPDPWAEATAAGRRAFRTGHGDPEVRADGAVAAALFVYAERMGHVVRHRLVVVTGRNGYLWVAAQCDCGGLDGPERRGIGAGECVMADYQKHVNGEETER